MAWNDNLTGAALRIAGNPNSPLRVVAGPGTGKTFALIRRVARILEGGEAPRRILVCTFTRTAADDLSKEISRLRVEGATEIVAGTLHAFCFRLLWRAEVLAGTGRVPRPLLDFETRFMLEDLSHRLGGIRICKKRLKAFSAAWARLQSEEPVWPSDPNDRQFHNALIGWLRFHKCMLVGEIIRESYHYLRNNPASPERTAFDHVLVDEYQDLNRAEQLILDLLAENGTLTVVGDEDQSIYSFLKHANREGIADFWQYHSPRTDETLVECRRCPQLVVDIANELIGHNSSRSLRTLTCLPGNPQGEIYIVQWTSLEEEAAGIARFVNSRVTSGGVEPGKVLILAPRRQLGYEVRNALNDMGTSAHSFFNEEVFEGSPKDLAESVAQQTFTLLILFANPDDIVALRCWCGYGSSSLRSGAWARIRSHCENTNLSLMDILHQLSDGTLSIANTHQIVDRFRELQIRLAHLQNLTGQTLVDALFPEGQEWAAALRLYAQINVEDDCDAPTLLERIKSKIVQPELPTDVEYVRVMSLHKSKGLTTDMVIILGCIAGMIPSIIPKGLTPLDQQRFIEEQRRLFFVALTRTSKTLVLSSTLILPRDLAYRMRVPLGRGGDATHARTRASMFLSELGPSAPQPLAGNQFLQQVGI